MKTINITDVSLKELDISKPGGLINIRLVYSLLDADGKEYDQKASSIKNEELTAGQKTYINNIISTVETKLKQRENI